MNRISNQVVSESDAVLAPDDFKVSNHTNKLFKMYDVDEVEVTHELKNYLMKDIFIDLERMCILSISQMRPS
ncbi:hypothetical protein EUBIFOR_01093 [Holdemanella biformis DSM 3989]|uniref:Uncharacterized protein n=1 Tax=Holdemanella biformis DSM 3989 TaxID=518637 RepID=B7CA72_9FIRM|nr:hypothetical protein EUBIFOR_01093 [Holdemanella biformis DSM 3989]